MGHYKSNLRDIEFNLFEVFGAEQALGTGPFAQLDLDSAKDILKEVDRLATNDLAASFTDADRNPPVFDPETSTVTTPESFKKSYSAYVNGGWDTFPLNAELGGIGAPPSLIWAFSEMVLGANPAIYMFAAGPAFAQILHANGTPEQKKFAELAIERSWGATMVLTEPDAGSDVGAGRAKATQQPDGTWHIEGTKRFITSAEWDWPENIFHLVLARPEGAGPGTKGLSLFLVPKFLVNADGSLGERNGAYVTNVEKKMGLKVSTTCELTFGETHPAIGTLVGDVHNGIAQMFQVIEYARMMVGTKAISTLSTGYLNALEYAKQRVQGADLTQLTDKAAPRVTIINHPDVRLMLMRQKAWAEGMRALVLYTATVQDQVEISQHDGGEVDDLAVRLNDLLLPIVKGYGSEKAYELLATSLQIFGGSGFTQDYPIEQYIRDAKIDTLYEGTTTIQGMDLFFRKIVRDQGAALGKLAAEIQDFAKGDAGNGSLVKERELLAQALDDVQGIVNHMVNDLMGSVEETRNVYKVGLNTTRGLMALGDLVVGWLLLRQAAVALDKVGAAAGKDKAFYEGKIATARWFAASVFPELTSKRAIAEATDLSLMDLDEAAF
ncbi:MAG: acyl-CoA dehydrogenase domain protein [Frankiales bacterium]|jgi:alkylation response protein AidB-like acyl-CoA dehydrogenase|nr:acyl-CoA dehydrogenase domain protein [Frankiales bacterium]